MIHALCPCGRAAHGSTAAQRSNAAAARAPAPRYRYCWRTVRGSATLAFVHVPRAVPPVSYVSRGQGVPQVAVALVSLVSCRLLHPGLVASRIHRTSGTGGDGAGADGNLAADTWHRCRGERASYGPQNSSGVWTDPGLPATSVPESDGSPAVAAAVTWPRRSLGTKTRPDRRRRAKRRRTGRDSRQLHRQRANARRSTMRAMDGPSPAEPPRGVRGGATASADFLFRRCWMAPASRSRRRMRRSTTDRATTYGNVRTMGSETSDVCTGCCAEP